MGAHDTDEDLSAMRGIFAAAVRASELLGVDAALRARWQEVLANLAALPTSNDPDALRPADYTGAPVFVRGLKPTANGNTGFTPDGNSLPMWYFDLVNLESPDRQLLAPPTRPSIARIARESARRPPLACCRSGRLRVRRWAA
jgi:hypothetical protein